MQHSDLFFCAFKFGRVKMEYFVTAAFSCWPIMGSKNVPPSTDHPLCCPSYASVPVSLGLGRHLPVAWCGSPALARQAGPGATGALELSQQDGHWAGSIWCRVQKVLPRCPSLVPGGVVNMWMQTPVPCPGLQLPRCVGRHEPGPCTRSSRKQRCAPPCPPHPQPGCA